MAGSISTDCFHVPGVTVVDLVARQCPVTERYGEVCQRYDPHTGECSWCPFMYGLQVRLGKHPAGECRTPDDAAHWMATHEMQETRSYLVRCLRAPSAGTSIGATRPRGI